MALEIGRSILGRAIPGKGNMEDLSGPEAALPLARSLNILLKTVRLYGAEHERATTLLGTAWENLRAVLGAVGKTDKRRGSACSIATSGLGYRFAVL